MASPTSKRSIATPRPAREVVDPRWLLRALGLAIGFAVLLGYLGVCLIVYRSGWQLMLTPSAKVESTPSVPFQALRFDAAATGTPRLSGWWIPTDSVSAPTILFLHDGVGSLSNCAGKLDLLHQAGVNIFAFDYRGYGQSDGPHPSEARMAEDASAALDYLTGTRHLSASTVIPYGEGVGGVLAAGVVSGRPELRALIVDNAKPDAFARAADDGNARWLPMRLLLGDRFDIASALSRTTVPKLLLSDATSPEAAAEESLYRAVSGAKITVTFAKADRDRQYVESIRRFVDEYFPGR